MRITVENITIEGDMDGVVIQVAGGERRILIPRELLHPVITAMNMAAE